MKKKHYAFILIALAILILPAYIIGIIFQYHYQQTLNLVSQQIKINLKLIDYKRHWFHSDALIAANFPLTDRPLELNDIDHTNVDMKNMLVIKQHISHGPFIFNRNNSASKVNIAAAYIDSFFDDNHHFAQTTLKFNRDIDSHFALNEYKITHQNKLLYALNGLFGDLKIDHNNSHLSSSIQIKNLVANLENHREITNFLITNEFTKNNYDVWTGKNQYHFDTLKWGQNDKFFDLKNVDYTMNSQVLKDRYKINIAAQIQSALYNNKDYGSQNIALTITDLNAEQLKPLQKSFSLTNSKHPDAQKHANYFQQHLLTLLNHGANIKLDSLRLNTAWGQINIKADIACPCPNNANNFANLFSSIQMQVQGYFPADLADTLLTNFYALHFNLPNPDAAKKITQESLVNWQNSGWLQVSGEYFLINLEQPRKIIESKILPSN